MCIPMQDCHISYLLAETLYVTSTTVTNIASTLSNLEPVDIASLMSLVRLTFGQPFRVDDEGARGVGKPRCGVCLFHLVPGAKSSNVDADEDLSLIKITWARSTRREFQASADRGYIFCRNILNFALNLGATDLTLKQQSNWQGVSITMENGTVEPFVFLLPPNDENYNEGRSSICRGLETVSIRGTAESEVLDEARLWWERCTQEHRCRAEPCTYIPRRLLRVERASGQTAAVVRLVEDLTESVEYVTLSHRWSEETKAVSLVNSNRCERIEEGVLSSALPRLMQDTIHVLNRFDIQYLWIDCMCIIQGSSADWKREAASMAAIYKNATFTISAVHCRGSNESLFSDPKQTLPAGYVGHLPGDIAVYLEHHIPHPFRYMFNAETKLEDFDDTIDSSLHLLHRGWVYQEVLLSPRTLYFLAKEIMWKCRECTVCQCARYDFDEISKERPDLKFITGKNGKIYYSERGCQQIKIGNWANIVRQYSAKNLTYQEDRLPALAGIAEEYGTITGWTYICGLWQENLRETFGWKRGSFDLAPQPESRVPTWSWASIATEIRIGVHWAQEVEFESCHVTYNNEGNPYVGDVEEAVLNVTGYVFTAKLVPPSRTAQFEAISHDPYDGRWGVSVLSRDAAWLSEDYILTETSDLVDIDVLCLILDFSGDGYQAPGLCDCLVLRGVGDNAERYQRLGRIHIVEDGIANDWMTQWNVSRKKLALV